jgi:hypothetical protein
VSARREVAGSAAPPARTAADVRSPSETWGPLFVGLILAAWAASLVVGFKTAVLWLTLAGFAAAVVGLRRPRIGVLAIGILCTMDSVARVYVLSKGFWKWNTFNYWLLLVVLLSIPVWLVVGQKPVRILEALVICLLAWLLLGSDLRNGLQHVLGLVSFFGLLVYLLRLGHDPATWYWLGVECGALAGVGGLMYYLQPAGERYENPNAWSYFPLTALFTICFALPYARRPMRAAILLVLGAVNVAWAFLCGSRGAMLIAALCVLYMLHVTRGAGTRLLLVGAALAAVVVLNLKFATERDYALHRIQKLVNASESMMARTSGRSEIARGSWYIFQQNPMGVGTGSFSPAWERLTFVPGLSGFGMGESLSAHSAWAKTLAENGIVGILLLTSFVLSFLVEGWKSRRRGIFALCALTTVVLAVAFTNTEFQGKGLWLLCAGTVVALRETSRARGLPAADASAWDPEGTRRAG